MNKEIERRLLAAFAKQQKGLIAEAEHEFASILVADPDNVHARNLLGVICLNSDRPSEAADHIQAALRLDPDDAEAHANLSLAYRAMGKLELARQSILTSLALEPERPSSLASYGSICLDMGAYRDAAANLSQALRRGPARPEWLVSLSSALCELGQVNQAIAAARHAQALKPDLPEALVSLGNALIKGCQYVDAATAFEQAIAASPNASDAWIGKGTALKEMGNAADAKRILKEACRRFPSEPRCHFTLGMLEVQTGQAAQAAAEFRAAIAANPGYGPAYFQLLQLPGDELARDELRRLELLAGNSEEHAASAHAHFAMARVLEKRGAFEAAMDQYQTGHRLLGRQNAYDDDRTIALYAEIAGNLRASEAATEEASRESAMPVFVVGMPRSGTTLIEQILSSHPMVGGAGESSFLEDCVRQAERMTGKPFPSCVNDLSPDQAMQLGSHYIGRISTGFAGASHIVDKTPMNFQYIALILRILPRARIVHCKRDALETCLSIFRLPFDPSQSYAHDLRALGIFYGHYSRLMAHTERVLGSAVFPVDLDVLIDDPAQTVAALCKFAGLEFDEAMLRFHDAERVVRTPSAMQVREPLRRAATPWGDRFGKAAAPLIDMLGDSLQKL